MPPLRGKDRFVGQKPASLSAKTPWRHLPESVRSLAKLLQQQSADTASAADLTRVVGDALEQVPQVHRKVQSTLDSIDLQPKSDKGPALDVALAVRKALQPKPAVKPATGYQLFYEEFRRQPTNGLKSQAVMASEAWESLSDEQRRAYDSRTPCTATTPSRPPTTPTTTTLAVQTSIVSDSEPQTEQRKERKDDGAVWGNILEAVRLQLALSSESCADRTYRAYALAGRVASDVSADQLRLALEKEFLAIYGPRRSGVLPICRVYTRWQSSSVLWVQLCLGRLNDGRSKRKPAQVEFVAVVETESPFVALVSGGRTSTRLTPMFLSALESALSLTTEGTWATTDVFSRFIDGIEGPNPRDVLLSAKAAHGNVAVARLAAFADSQSTNPVAELESTATADFADAGSEASAQHVAGDVESLVKHYPSDDITARKRYADDYFGNHCPQRKRVRWECKGNTTAASASWLDSPQESKKLPMGKFKCRIVMQGSNVFAGMHAMVEAGLMETPLPSQVRDAPRLGGTICVELGK